MRILTMNNSRSRVSLTWTVGSDNDYETVHSSEIRRRTIWAHTLLCHIILTSILVEMLASITHKRS